MGYGYSKLSIPIDRDQRGKEGVFSFYYFKGTKLPIFGYKIHISASRDNVLKIRKIVSDYCKRNKVNFKVISTKRIYLTSLIKSFDRTFVGKYLTLYPEDSDHARHLCKELYELLKDERGPVILTDRAYRDSIIQYRHGAFLSEYPQGSGKIIDSDGYEFKDARVPGSYKPEEIDDLFDQPDFDIPVKIKDYVIKTPIFFSNYGGVYLVQRESELDLEKPHYYVIKEGRENLGLTNLDDPLIRKRYEAELASGLNHLSFLPKFHEHFYMERNLYLVFDYSPGLGLDRWKDQLNLNSVWQLHPNRKGLIEDAAMRLIDRFTSLFKEAKGEELVLNDVKSNNFVWDGDMRLSFIDLDCSFRSSDKPISIVNRYLKQDRVTDWTSDIRKCGYILAELLSSSDFLQCRYTDHRHTLEYFLYFASVVDLDTSLRDRIYKLLTFKGGEIDDIYKPLTRSEMREVERLSKPRFSLKAKRRTLSKPKLLDRVMRESGRGEQGGFASQLWDAAYESLESNDKERSIEAIDKLVGRVIDTVEEYKTVLIEEEVISTSLNNGASKLIILLTLFAKRYEDSRYNSLIEDLVSGIEGRFSLNTTLFDGGWGIILALFEAYKLLGRSSYLTSAEELAYTLLHFFKDPKSGGYFNSTKSLLTKEELGDIQPLIDSFEVVGAEN